MLAIVDVETTGASVTGDRIIEIGVKRVEQGRVVRTYETLVDPEQRIPRFIEQLTGIRNEDVEGAPTFRAIREELEAVLDGCIFVAHLRRHPRSVTPVDRRPGGIAGTSQKEEA